MRLDAVSGLVVRWSAVRAEDLFLLPPGADNEPLVG
jgi:hypothetical protein